VDTKISNIMEYLKTFKESIDNKSYNGVIYFSSLENDSNEYICMWFKDDSDKYKEFESDNSIGAIKELSFYASDIVEKLTGLQSPYSFTELSDKFDVMSYGFKMDGDISNINIDDLKKSLSEKFNVIKIEKKKFD